MAELCSPGERLFAACQMAFNLSGSWKSGSALKRQQYSRAAKAFLASDPLTATARETHEALRDLVALVADFPESDWHEMDAARRALAKAEAR